MVFSLISENRTTVILGILILSLSIIITKYIVAAGLQIIHLVAKFVKYLVSHEENTGLR